MTTLRDRLIGTWHLISYEARQTGGTTIYPMGESLEGRLTYTEGGDVSVHIMSAGRPNLASGDISQGTTEESAAAARGYFGYCGTFEIDEERGSLTHVVALSLMPNWIGERQVRSVDLAGDRLELSGPPTRIAGAIRTAHLTWRCAFPTRVG